MAGRMLRSRPTIAPTKALTTTSSENWPRFSDRLRRMVTVCASSAGEAKIRPYHGVHVRGSRWNAARQLIDEGRAIHRENRVPALLETQRRRWLAREAHAAGAAGLVPGKDFEIIGQHEEFRVQAVVEYARHFAFPAGQVWPADRSNEEGVAGDDEPGRITAALVCHEQADAVRRMPRCVQDLYLDVSDVEHLPVPQGMDREVHRSPVGFMQAERRLHGVGQCSPAGVVIRVQMGVDDVCDRHLSLYRRLDEPIFIARDDIDRNGLAVTCAPEEVRNRRVVIEALPEKHYCPLGTCRRRAGTSVRQERARAAAARSTSSAVVERPKVRRTNPNSSPFFFSPS